MPTQPQFLALAPEQRHCGKELRWGPAVLGARSPLIQGQSALACGSWDECHGFVPTGASWSPESLQAAWAVPQLSIHTGCERDGGSWWVPREHWELSPTLLRGAGSPAQGAARPSPPAAAVPRSQPPRQALGMEGSQGLPPREHSALGKGRGQR